MSRAIPGQKYKKTKKRGSYCDVRAVLHYWDVLDSNEAGYLRLWDLKKIGGPDLFVWLQAWPQEEPFCWVHPPFIFSLEYASVYMSRLDDKNYRTGYMSWYDDISGYRIYDRSGYMHTF